MALMPQLSVARAGGYHCGVFAGARCPLREFPSGAPESPIVPGAWATVTWSSVLRGVHGESTAWGDP